MTRILLTLSIRINEFLFVSFIRPGIFNFLVRTLITPGKLGSVSSESGFGGGLKRIHFIVTVNDAKANCTLKNYRIYLYKVKKVT